VAAKKVETPKEEDEQEPPIVETEQVEPIIQPHSNVKDDWEDEKSAEEIALQSLVDRLHEKGEREVTRIVKVSLDPCWTDARPSTSTSD